MEKTKILFDVFVSEPIPVNKVIYRSWLDGYSEKETAYSKDLSSNVHSLNNSNMIINTGNSVVTTPIPLVPGSSNMSVNSLVNTPIGVNSSLIQNIQSTQVSTGSMANSNSIVNKEPIHLLLGETEDQFRNFTLLQTALEHPKTLSSNSMFQIDIINKRLLIEGYYDFDESFMRELIGRKLTSGQRRDLDDTAEKLRIRLSSCERQFDNLKRISRLVFSDLKTSALDIIMNEFSLNRDLSRKYVRILFLCFHRIDLSKKRVQPLKTFGLIRLSEIVMSHWGDPLRSYTMELDIKLKEDVRDLKTYLTSQKDIPEKYWKLIKARYQTLTSSPKISSSTPSQAPTPVGLNTGGQLTPSSATGFSNPNSIQNSAANSTILLASSLVGEKLKNLESKFKPILKGILSIGSSLSDSKEFRNLFEDIAEKIIDPLKRIDLLINETDTFFILLRDVFVPESLGLHSLRHKDRIVHNWKSFLEGIRGVVVYIYNEI
ncbi:hypothetical protein DLAC_00251 [Tieghemostelium lacteum]|uniref:Uncharacterized protein n=1 Tax=Tieghemostelium lacteum TaxID=361077 RepID=A0A152A9P8_TIELA|nr:hypothetical protein DLAC_00251 [Tieghemostelium lacteum]|eukprot:KYR02787.1 hypothetical protein DLAC_00251 [Tieghemostelium lacteum]